MKANGIDLDFLTEMSIKGCDAFSFSHKAITDSITNITTETTSINTEALNINVEKFNKTALEYTEIIEGPYTKTITGDCAETIEGTYDKTFVGDHTETFDGTYDKTFVGEHTETITGSYTKTITGDCTETIIEGTYTKIAPEILLKGECIMSDSDDSTNTTIIGNTIQTGIICVDENSYTNLDQDFPTKNIEEGRIYFKLL